MTAGPWCRDHWAVGGRAARWPTGPPAHRPTGPAAWRVVGFRSRSAWLLAGIGRDMRVPRATLPGQAGAFGLGSNGDEAGGG
ncbi:hypothetical protein BL253_22230 [Pseudofrankia asymbiotica]|uniref:Uncharacterized protein n=1 Tax=Pseudofrankia asymbiotica TaxID=1834516 RepID=A0A1V2I7B2_9ACTN|nr:hypothetical protein BL253_22230 [Pseudofrankia asymbiotica]